MPAAPSQEEIAARAYELWVSRGRPEGTDQDNWHEAEQQLQNRHRSGPLDPESDRPDRSIIMERGR